ncbi:uncharacterized protein AB675_112 [Cyphellophora attinorum]|uniref:Uncharacterized protein n=1 Tax=Cyphellophora attinorum TaxID=1664694 RepID=A0A0N0NKC8_9EURO|nr:uncharacterized protein AB675_112 [Phialophora attinorum]KPI37689.1 hypothetical protein AB675_112 [Phialophora attinorum]
MSSPWERPLEALEHTIGGTRTLLTRMGNLSSTTSRDKSRINELEPQLNEHFQAVKNVLETDLSGTLSLPTPTSDPNVDPTRSTDDIKAIKHLQGCLNNAKKQIKDLKSISTLHLGAVKRQKQEYDSLLRHLTGVETILHSKSPEEKSSECIADLNNRLAEKEGIITALQSGQDGFEFEDEENQGTSGQSHQQVAMEALKELDDAKSAAQQKDLHIKQLEQAQRATSDKNEKLKAEVLKKDSHIRELQQTQQEVIDENDELKLKGRKKNAHIKKLEQTQQAMSEEIGTLKAEVLEKDTHIEQIQQNQPVVSDENEKLRADSSEKDLRIKELEQSQQATSEDNAKLRADILKKDQQLGKVKEHGTKHTGSNIPKYVATMTKDFADVPEAEKAELVVQLVGDAEAEEGEGRLLQRWLKKTLKRSASKVCKACTKHEFNSDKLENQLAESKQEIQYLWRQMIRLRASADRSSVEPASKRPRTE